MPRPRQQSHLLERFHYEDIKASIRKKWGSINAFESQQGLPKNSVSDYFRGRRSRKVQAAVERHILSQFMSLPASGETEGSPVSQRAHRLNREAA